MNAHTFPILRLLADGRFHSGEAMARQCKVSRATVWKAIQEAQSLGVEIFSVPGRGYKLPHAISLLDYHAVLQALGEQRAWLQVQIHPQLASTNSFLMQQPANSVAHGTCVATDMQTQGRGRRGRTWQAGLGASLTFSLLWRFQCGAAGLSGLSLAIGVALMRGLNELGLSQAKLKWPNDVLVKQGAHCHKLAGILIELQGDMEGPSAAVIGVGVNLRLPAAMKEEIDQPVMDLATVLDKPVSSSELLGVLLRHMAAVLNDFEPFGFERLRDEWMSAHAYHHQPVKMLMPDGTALHGVVNGVAQDGVLLVQTDQGERRFASGEISLRGVAS